MLILLVVGGRLAAAPLGIDLRFERLNGVYEDLEADVEPIQSGPVTIRLSSPEHRLELKSHEVRISPDSGDRHKLWATVRFSGTGSLIADLDFGGIPAAFEDQVEFPDQQVQIEAKVRIEVVESGFEVTAEELPRFVNIEMKSRLGGELVEWCKRLALFVAGDAGCSELDERLSRPRLPLPAPGASHLVSFEELTAEERARIELYLVDL